MGEGNNIVCHLFQFNLGVSTFTGKLHNTQIWFEGLFPLFVMEKEHGLGVLSRVLDEMEEFVVDRERNVCDPILSVGNVSVSRERLWKCNLQGNDVLNFCSSFSYYFSIEQTLPFPEFVECARIVILPPKELL